jgi:hypothetical protein
MAEDERRGSTPQTAGLSIIPIARSVASSSNVPSQQASALGGLAMTPGIHTRGEPHFSFTICIEGFRRWQNQVPTAKTSSAAALACATATAFARSGRCPAKNAVVFMEDSAQVL